jgi:hypothetical protein
MGRDCGRSRTRTVRTKGVPIHPTQGTTLGAAAEESCHDKQDAQEKGEEDRSADSTQDLDRKSVQTAASASDNSGCKRCGDHGSRATVAEAAAITITLVSSQVSVANERDSHCTLPPPGGAGLGHSSTSKTVHARDTPALFPPQLLEAGTSLQPNPGALWGVGAGRGRRPGQTWIAVPARGPDRCSPPLPRSPLHLPASFGFVHLAAINEQGLNSDGLPEACCRQDCCITCQCWSIATQACTCNHAMQCLTDHYQSIFYSIAPGLASCPASCPASASGPVFGPASSPASSPASCPAERP